MTPGISGRTQVFGLLGHPVRHSLSPAMHNRLFAEVGVDAVYVCFDVHPENAAHVADAIRTLDLRGVNLTVPFKAAVLGQVDRVTRAAEEARAANVVIHHDGFLTAYNTDGEGFVRGLEEEVGEPPADAHVVVLGAGGSARAIAAALADRGARRVTFLNRTRTSAGDSAVHLGTYFPKTSFDSGPLTSAGFADVARDADLVVVCTAGGAVDVLKTLDVSVLPDRAVVCDINYWMPDPPLLAAARARGLRVQDGLAMLVHQGALSFELFTGLEVDPAHIRAGVL